MITQLSISGYKALNNSPELSVKHLNILAGANASGKSSLIQVLLLLRQSLTREGKVEELLLSGDLYEAGTAQDVFHPNCGRKIEITLKDGSRAYNYEFGLDREKGDATSDRRLLSKGEVSAPPVLGDNTGAFCYVNAERVGPRVTYGLPSKGKELAGIVGKFGEFTTAVLARAARNVTCVSHWNESFIDAISTAVQRLDEIDLRADLTTSEGRLDLVCNYLLNWIIPGAQFDASESHATDSSTLNFIRDSNASKTATRPTHIGFGLTYALPIITAALALKSEGLLIIENPEAHLHPFSQSRMGVFLALMAAQKRQIIVETHSDHIINGIRLAIKLGGLDHNLVTLNSFNHSSDLMTTEIDQIGISKNGRPDRWPEGFFDQIENDLMRL